MLCVHDVDVLLDVVFTVELCVSLGLFVSCNLSTNRRYVQMMQPRKGFVISYGGYVGMGVYYRLLCTACLIVVSVVEPVGNSFDLWGQTSPAGQEVSIVRSVFVLTSLYLWSLRGLPLFLSLARTPFVRYVCCIHRRCIRAPRKLVEATVEAKESLLPIAPHSNEVLADTVGALLGEGIGILGALVRGGCVKSNVFFCR